MAVRDGGSERHDVTDHGLASYLSRVLDLPWETDSRLEELLQLACESLGVHSVSLETPTDKVTVLTPGSSWDAAEDQVTTTELTVADDETLTIRSREELTDGQVDSAHAWAGLVKLLHAPAQDPFADDFVTTLRTVRHALEETDDEEAAAQYVIRSALRTVGGDAAWFAARTDEGLVIRADSGFDDPRFARAWLLKAGEGVGGRAFSHGQTVIANDYLHDRRRVKAISKMADREGVRSVLVAPVRRGERIDGALYIMSRRPHSFHRRESDRLTVLGEELGYALTRITDRLGLVRQADEAHGRFDRLLLATRATQTGTEVLLTGGSIDSALSAVARMSEVGIEVTDSTREAPIVAGDVDLPEKRGIDVAGSGGTSATISLFSEAGDDTTSEQLAAGIAQLVRLHWANQRSNLRLRRDFVATLLRHEVKNPNESVREALAIGLDLSRHRLVAYAVATDGAPWDESTAGVLEHLVNERLKASLCIWFDRGLAVLADLAAMSAREVHEAFGTIVSDARLAQARLVVGVGSRCEGPADYARSWREARMAARFATHRRHPAVVEIDELGAFSLFARADLDSRLGADVDLLLGPLQEMNASMVETLDAYVHSGFSVEEAAQLLHVHPNTLRYRLRRVQERFGMDLSHGDQRFLLELGLRVRRLMTEEAGTDTAP